MLGHVHVPLQQAVSRFLLQPADVSRPQTPPGAEGGAADTELPLGGSRGAAVEQWGSSGGALSANTAFSAQGVPPVLHLLQPQLLVSLTLALCPPLRRRSGSHGLSAEPVEPNSRGGKLATPTSSPPSAASPPPAPPPPSWGAVAESALASRLPIAAPLAAQAGGGGASSQNTAPEAVQAMPPAWLRSILTAVSSRLVEEMAAAASGNPRAWFDSRQELLATTGGSSVGPSHGGCAFGVHPEEDNMQGTDSALDESPDPIRQPKAWQLAQLTLGLAQPPWGPYSLAGPGHGLTPAWGAKFAKALSRSNTGAHPELLDHIVRLAAAHAADVRPRDLAYITEAAARLGGGAEERDDSLPRTLAPAVGAAAVPSLLLGLAPKVLSGPLSLTAPPQHLLRLIAACTRIEARHSGLDMADCLAWRSAAASMVSARAAQFDERDLIQVLGALAIGSPSPSGQAEGGELLSHNRRLADTAASILIR